MAGKKKTVKDLNVDVINLAVRFKNFEEIINGITRLNDFKDIDKKLDALNKNEENEKKIADLVDEVKRLKAVVNDLKDQKREEIVKKVLDCNVCKETFNSRNELNAHRKSKHTKQIKCQFCEETFDENYKLENHLIKHETKGYKCDECEKTFHLEWRFHKHQLSHNSTTIRKCHYFNNDKICPFEEIGCMFMHETSSKCKYDKLCRLKLCSFQHERRDITKNVDNERSEILNEEIVTDTESDSEIDELECHTCGKVFNTESELWEHESSDEMCGYGCEECGAYYREEVHLKVHLEKHCTKCCNEFSPKSALEAHKKICVGMIY